MDHEQPLYILGAGGHGRAVADLAEACGYTDIRFIDPRWPELSRSAAWPVVAADHHGMPKGSAFAVANGDNDKRLAMVRSLLANGYELPVLIHPTAAVSRHAVIGSGTVVMAQAAVNVCTTVGISCIINTGATVDHDCVLADGVHVSPGAHLAGTVQVGQESWIGIGAAVKQGVKISARVTVGAGACVVSEVAAGQTVVGVPARVRT